MQKHPKPLDVKTQKELEALIGRENAVAERLELARLFRFLSQENNPYVRVKRPKDEIKFKKFYDSHKKSIDKLHFILKKYKIDPESFITYAVNIKKVYTPELILRPEIFKMYADDLYVKEKYDSISETYERTIRNIVEKCVEEGITPRKFIVSEFRNNRIAYDFISGRISKYFLVAIQDFKKIYEKLDDMNKTELRIIYDATDELKTMVNEAVFRKTGHYPRPIRDSEEAYEKLMSKTTKTSN